MADGIGLALDTSFLINLRKADEHIKDLTNNTNRLSKITIDAFQQMAQKGVTPYVEQLIKQKKAFEEVGKIKGSGRVLTQMKNEAKVVVDEINNIIKALQKTKAYKGEQSGKTAISFANSVLGQRGEAKSINNMRLAIRQLEDAQNRLNLNTKTGQKNYQKIGETIQKVKTELDKATNSNKNLTRESENASKKMSSMGDVMRKIRQLSGTIFSVQALMGYGNQLLKIRGEFEMQHRSLQVLLQDVDKANELWDKTVSLAVKSPFRVKELVTYTKQLAAYRVEADKLYETNRMLADVSAGLGVDMNRLILAFGQVKAANYLRGTELRQFSEAGVNMLDELAKRFTALEGRVVTVGDVFERVSKRMVSFADVEAVFQTITSEGGVFYKMQEKQSETLRGMMMNLRDSIDLMFNDIGMSQDSSLKGAVRLVKELVDNWRKFIPVIKAAGAALLAGFSVKIIAGIGKAFSSLWAVIASNPIGAAITIISALVVGIISARKNVNELAAALNQVDTEITKQLEESITLYRKLAERVKDVTATEEERSEAMAQIKSKFDEILPDQLLELEYIKGISDNYDEATAAMMNYYNSKAIEQKKDRLETKYGEDIDTERADLIRGTRKMIGAWSEKGLITERDEVALLAGVGGIINEVSEGIKNGEIDNSFDNVRRVILQKLSEYSGVDSTWDKYIAGGGSMLFEKNINEIIKTLGEYRLAAEGIMGLPTKTYAEQEAADIFLPQKENIENVKSTFKEVINLVNEYAGLAASEWTELDKRFEKIVGKLPEEASAYLPLLYDMLEKMKVAAVGFEGKEFDFGKSIQGFQQEFTHGLADVMWSQTGAYMFDPLNEGIHKELVQLVTNMDNTLRDEAAKLNLTPFQESVVSAMEIIAKETGVSVNEFVKFLPKMGDSASTTRKAVEGEIALLKSDIERWNNSLQAMPPASIAKPDLDAEREDTLGLTQEQVDKYAKLVEAYTILWKFVGGGEKDKKGGASTLDERIKVIDQMNKKYKELKKTLSEGESLEGAFKAYKDAFATAYGREDVRDMSVDDFMKNVLNFASEDEIVVWLENLAASVSKKADKVKVELAIGKFEMEEKERDKKKLDEALEKEIQDMFDQYDLSLDLKKLNISPEIAKSLFGIESIGLEDIRKKVEDELKKAKALGGNEDRIKQLEKDLEKINDMEEDAQIKRLKTYLEYTRNAIGERAKVKIEEMNKLQEIEETFNKAAADAKTEEDKKRIEEQRKLAEAGVKRESSDKANKLDWDEFRSSETFISIFQDLDNASDALLEHAIAKIREFQEQWTDMPISDAKEMINKLNELELALLDTGKPFKDYRKANEEIEKAMVARQIKPNAKSGSSQEELREKIGEENEEMDNIITRAQLIESTLQTINNAIGENKIKQLDAIGINKDYVESLGLSEGVLTNSVEANQEIIDGEKEKASQASKNIAQNNKILQQLSTQQKRLQEQADALNNAKKMANDLYDAFKSLTETLVGDDPAMIFAEMGMNMANTVLDTIMLQIQLEAAKVSATGLGVAMNAAMGVIGWIVMAIQLLVQGIMAAVNYAEKMRQMKLDVLAGQVDNLKQKFDALAESIDDAWSIKQIQDYEKELDAVQDKMEETQRQYIALLESGKDGDTIDLAKQAQEKLDNGWSVDDLSKKERKALLSEEYQDYKDATDALLEMEEDYEEQKREILEDAGGITDPYDAAGEFVDAWLDAYKETGDGLAGLEESFDEFFINLIKQKATRALSDTLLQDWINTVNEAVSVEGEKGRDITDSEKEKIRDAQEKAKHDINNALLGIFEGIDLSGATSGGLTALQKGIQGITEQQADVIESYLNSIRMYVASSNSELVNQTKYMRDIYNLLNDVAGNGSRAFSIKGL